MKLDHNDTFIFYANRLLRTKLSIIIIDILQNILADRFSGIFFFLNIKSDKFNNKFVRKVS